MIVRSTIFGREKQNSFVQLKIITVLSPVITTVLTAARFYFFSLWSLFTHIPIIQKNKVQLQQSL